MTLLMFIVRLCVRVGDKIRYARHKNAVSKCFISITVKIVSVSSDLIFPFKFYIYSREFTSKVMKKASHWTVH